FAFFFLLGTAGIILAIARLGIAAARFVFSVTGLFGRRTGKFLFIVTVSRRRVVVAASDKHAERNSKSRQKTTKRGPSCM
ncbi:MAG: hypothetical protein IKE34_09015, partial [Paenibacillus sp.]|nr:hypothetical protein [Paenibacillus sp.]